MSIKNLSSQEYDILNKIAAKTEQSASGAVDITYFAQLYKKNKR